MKPSFPRFLQIADGQLLNSGPSPEAGGRRYLNHRTGQVTTAFFGRVCTCTSSCAWVRIENSSAMPPVKLNYNRISRGGGLSTGERVIVAFLVYGESTEARLGWRLSEGPALRLTPAPSYRPSPNAMLAASKAMHTLGLIDTSFQLGIWTDPKHREAWTWDLAVKIDHKNLKHVSLQLIDLAKKIICDVTVEFNGRGDAVMVGAPRGTEVPLINRKAVASHRVIVVNVVADESAYANLQRLKWSEAEALTIMPGSDIKTTHGRKTGGRQAGVMHVARQLRQTLVITRPIGARGYGFAACESLGLTGIYLQSIHMDCAAAFLATGRKISAVLVQTLEGIQARDVKPVG